MNFDYWLHFLKHRENHPNSALRQKLGVAKVCKSTRWKGQAWPIFTRCPMIDNERPKLRGSSRRLLFKERMANSRPGFHRMKYFIEIGYNDRWLRKEDIRR